jgi:Tol biopolymer transport system component
VSSGRWEADLPDGLQLGPYKIESLLGAGGMGQVYRARDQRLNRPVAVKILPAVFASDPDRLRRFEFEARAAGALSHPNILVVHDVGRFKDRPFIVEELLEGETLRDRLRGRFFAPQRAVDIARQIARGLAAAHAKGIVHRDLKPSNVFLSRDGTVKILDFGLAKLREPEMRAGEPETGSTAGLMGTVGYLSPEQARGDPADHRADIFALGCVLYEMLTGRKAFGGSSSAEILAATLTRDPPSLSHSVSDVPASLARVVHRCLEKELDDRFSSAHDLSLALESTQDDLSRPRWWRRPVYVRRSMRRAAALALLAAVVLALVFLSPRPRTTSPLPELIPRRLTSGAGLEAHPALSPDGGEVVYAATEAGNTDIWLVDAEGGRPLHLTPHPAHDDHPSWLPDGNSVVFASDRGGGHGIWKVSRLGGQPVLLVPNARDPAVSPDGRLIAFTRRDDRGFFRVGVAPLDDVAAARTLSSGGLWDDMRPAWSPDGRSIAYSDFNHLWIVPVDGGPPRRMTPAGGNETQPAWSPDGEFLYFTAYREGIQGIWRRPVEGGEPALVSAGPGERVWPSLSRDGRRLVYATAEAQATLTATDAESGRRARFEEARSIFTPTVAPDGSAVVFVSVRHNTVDLWRLPLGEEPLAGMPDRVTDHEGRSAWPRFSLDGRWIAYYRTVDDGQRDIWTVATEGGPSIRFTEHPALDVTPVWSPDGSMLAFASDRDGTQELWVALIQDGRRAGEPWRVTDDASPVDHLAWSPDGRHLAYTSLRDGDGDVYLTDREGNEIRALTEGAGAERVRWEESSGRLLVLGLWGDRRPSLRILDPETLDTVPLPYEAVSGSGAEIAYFDSSPDGRWLVVVEERHRGDVWLLETRDGTF